MFLSRQRVLFQLFGRCSFHTQSIADRFIITPEIKDALKRQGPVVALESTIISHGWFHFLLFQTRTR